MIIVYVPTKVRGFLKSLFNSSFKNIKFVWNENKVYEVNSKIKMLIAKLVKSKIADKLGIIQRINVRKNDFDLAFSYNRFLKTKKNYIIYLENPTALFHYSLDRNKTNLGRRRIKKYLHDNNLKAIICLSKACFNTINNFYEIPKSIKIEQIYPLIPKNPYIDINQIKKKSFNNRLNCLYISSNFFLKGGREIIECFKLLEDEGFNNIHLKVITDKSSLNQEIIKDMATLKNIEIEEFNFTKEELNKIYAENNILLNPTRQDSFSMVVLEAMKAGNAILSTDLYAIPEMVIDGKNGYLTKPKYRFFDQNNMPNEEVWNNRKETIYSNFVDEQIVRFLFEKLKLLYCDRELLEKLSINSFIMSNNDDFNEENIKNKWSNLIFQLITKNEV